MQENCEDLFGIGDYKKGYINTLNIRSEEYSEYEFTKVVLIILFIDILQKKFKMLWVQVKLINGLWIRL